MALKIYPCEELAKKILETCAQSGRAFLSKYKRNPSLAVVLVGDDPASAIYVRKKSETCRQYNIKPVDIILPATVSQNELQKKIESLNADPQVDGILIQSPLPKSIDEKYIHTIIDPKKDVDCFHPYNVGLLTLDPLKALAEGMVPCTPAGVMEVFKENNIQLRGKKVVVIGRSNIVGKPMLLLLQAADATVISCHSHTKNLEKICKDAHVIVSAVGKPNYITKDFIGDGAVIIDVGINRMKKDGKSVVVGDVDFTSIQESSANFLTPVPRGIGPMTIAILIRNTVRAAWIREENHSCRILSCEL